MPRSHSIARRRPNRRHHNTATRRGSGVAVAVGVDVLVGMGVSDAAPVGVAIGNSVTVRLGVGGASTGDTANDNLQPAQSSEHIASRIVSICRIARPFRAAGHC